ncbi:phage exclusion protein Lit family protein [Pseudooceanicola sp. 200-1SW]|uniref:phage exclusion protein Lit family protein n=1 Tax=Pseudooceanicola sp. 200-1SW TaxID=3425949 RepID=UPI003D7F9CD1
MTDDVMTENDQAVQQAARNLFLGCVPERKAELEDFWEKYHPEFQLMDDAGSGGTFALEAGLFKIVRFNHLAMRAFWLASFIAWEGYSAFYRSTGAKDINLTRFRSMVQAFRDMLSAEDPEVVQLPPGVPEPGKYCDVKNDVEARAAGELATIATGWAFLHELRHIQHQQDGTSAAFNAPSTDQHAEELSCDEFATTFIMEFVANYAEQSGDDEDKVRQKREVGVYFALFAMALIAADQWGASESHPAIESRIENVIKNMGAEGTGISDAIAHAAFAALRIIYPDAPKPFGL